MRYERGAAVVTWVYVAAFGIPAVPVAAYLLDRGVLPRFANLFPMYGGPWSARVDDTTLVVLLAAFLAVTVVAAWSAWLVWKGSRRGRALALALLPVEAVFWIGFALPFPWLLGALRAALILGGRGRIRRAAPSPD